MRLPVGNITAIKKRRSLIFALMSNKVFQSARFDKIILTMIIKRLIRSYIFKSGRNILADRKHRLCKFYTPGRAFHFISLSVDKQTFTRVYLFEYQVPQR